MVKIHRIWFNTERMDREDHYKITLFGRPRVSIRVDEYIWSFIEENIVKPHKLMRSEKHGYLLSISFDRFDSAKHRYYPRLTGLTRQNTDIIRFPRTTGRFGKVSRWTAQTEAISARTLQAAKIGLPGSLPITAKHRYYPLSPYNGPLREGVEMDSANRSYFREDFAGGKDRTTWFSPNKIWTNCGDKVLNVDIKAANVSENITPREYADLLFDGIGAALVFNFKRLKREEFDGLKPKIDWSVDIKAANVSESITPREYADLLFDGIGAALVFNFKRLKREEFDGLKPKINWSVVESFPFPASFEEQQYIGDEGEIHVYSWDGQKETTLVGPYSVRGLYLEHFGK